MAFGGSIVGLHGRQLYCLFATLVYKRGCFVLEGKDTGKKVESDGWDAAITKAVKQAENYHARSLPIEEGRPPFIVVVDVGISFSLFSEFSRSGGNYPPHFAQKFASGTAGSPHLVQNIFVFPFNA